jgi:hypothetical protein
MATNLGNNDLPTSPKYTWDDVIKKEARSGDNMTDLGEVQEVGRHYIMTQKGVVNKEKFYLPKYLVIGFDGETLWFDEREDLISQFRRDTPPEYGEYLRYRKQTAEDIETTLPWTARRHTVDKDHRSTVPLNVTWEQVMGKDARDLRHVDDLGTVKEVGKNYIVTEKGLVNKEKLFLPKYLVHGFDGTILWFNITEKEKGVFKRETPPAYDEYSRYADQEAKTREFEDTVPVVDEIRSDID